MIICKMKDKPVKSILNKKYLYLFCVCIFLISQIPIAAPSINKQSVMSNKKSNNALTLLYPTGGETFYIEDVIPVSWEVNLDSVSFVLAYASLDSGKTWIQILDTTASSLTGNAPRITSIIRIDTLFWKPTMHDFGENLQDIIDTNVKTIPIRMRIKDYGDIYIIDTDFLTLSVTPIEIVSSIRQTSQEITYTLSNRMILLDTEPISSAGKVCMYTLDGKLIKQIVLPGYRHKHRISIADLVSGIYLLKVWYYGQHTSVFKLDVLF